MAGLLGEKLGAYEIVEEIGRGGMAIVYRGYHPQTERHVAIKVVREDMLRDPNFLARFEREARLVASLQHPHILPIFDFGQEGNITYLVMPYVPTGTLKERLNQGLMSIEETVHVMTQIAGAVGHAHFKGIIHRDIKPANVLLDESGNALLTDFGLAKMMASLSQLTGSGSITGTPTYMSPEQGQGLIVDARSDLYALGVVLYEMLTGEQPYSADTPVAIIFKHISEPIPSPLSKRPDLPEQFTDVIVKALAKSPDKRFQSADALIAALQSVVDKEISSGPEPIPVLEPWMEEMRRQAVQTSTRHAPIVNAPPLPINYIERPEELERLGTMAQRKTDSRHIAVTVVHGMGGSGKSVLASALCRDAAVHNAYRDGVIWISIGRESSGLLTQLAEVGKALGDVPVHYTSLEAGTNRLREIMAEAAVLIILDDVWDGKHVEPFLVESPSSHLLITTRDSGIGLNLGAEQITLGMLSPEQSVDMLKAWSGREDPELSLIAERLGYLPLAIKLTGARLKEGMSAADWLGTFQNVSQIKLGRRSADPSENLAVCFDLSVEQLSDEDRALYHTLGIFPEDIWVPQHVVVRLWQQLHPELSAYDCNELIVDLARLALIERDAENSTVRLHDLLHSYNRERVTGRVVEINQALLAAYNPDSKPWHEILNDGYLYNHLAYHLIESQRSTELIELLTGSSDWMTVKFVAGTGDTSYVSDLLLAITQYNDPVDSEEISQLINLYTALHSIKSKATSYTDLHLETLVLLGKTDEALAYARLRIDPELSFRGIMTIYEATKKQSQIRVEILEEAHDQIHSCTDLRFKVQSLLQVYRKQTEVFVQDKALLLEALSFAQSPNQDLNDQVFSLCDVAVELAAVDDKLAESVLEQAKSKALELEGENRVHRLCDVAQAIIRAGREEQLSKLLDFLRQQNLLDNASIQYRLSTLLAEAEQWQKALELVQSLPPEKRVSMLIKLAGIAADTRSDLVFDILDDVWKHIETLNGDTITASHIADMLKLLVRFRDVKKAKELMQMTESQSDFAREQAHDAWITALIEQGELDQASAHLDSLEGSTRARSTSLLCRAYAKAGVYDRAFALATSLDDDKPPRFFDQTSALSSIIASMVENGHTIRALKSAQDIETLWNIADVEIVEHKISWSDGGQMAHASGIASTLGAIASALVLEGQYQQAYDMVHKVNKPGGRQYILSRIAYTQAEVGDPRAYKTLGEAASIVHDIQAGYLEQNEVALRHLVEALAQLGQHERALSLVNAIVSPTKKVQALCAIADAQLQDERTREQSILVLQKAAQTILDIENRDLVLLPNSMLTELVRHLTRIGQLPLALDISDRVPWLKGEIVDVLANDIGDISNATEVSATITHHTARVSALAHIGKRLTFERRENASQFFQSALDFALAAKRGERRADSLRSLIVSLAQSRRTDLALELVYDEKYAWAWKEHSSTTQEVVYGPGKDVIMEIVKSLLVAGDIQQAMALAESEGLTGSIAAELASLGKTDEALTIARRIGHPGTRFLTTAMIDLIAAESGTIQLGEILKQEADQTLFQTTLDEVDKNVKYPMVQAEFLTTIATVLSNLNDKRADNVFMQALGCAEAPVDFEYSDMYRANTIREVVFSMLKAGRVFTALGAFNLLGLDDIIRVLSEWSYNDDQISPDKFALYLTEVIRIAGWVRHDWLQVHQILSGETATD